MIRGEIERTDVSRTLGLLGIIACLGAVSGTYAQDDPSVDEQVSAFVRRILQDKSGHMWFGTNGDGVIRLTGESLEYFSVREGFGGEAVRGIVEDAGGQCSVRNVGRKLTRFDGVSFMNYTEQDGLASDDVWSLAIDGKGVIWVGTLQGVSCFDGEVFTPFELPESAPDPTRGVTSARIVHSIMEDSKGRMWFGTTGGAWAYDGESLFNLAEKDGLCSNSVNDILEAADGEFWFATHHQGICRWDGRSFTHVGAPEAVAGTEVWDLYEDRAGSIWFPVEGHGVYRYDGTSFRNFSQKDGLASLAIQCAHQDREGRLWFGGWLGLYRYDGKSFVNFTRSRLSPFGPVQTESGRR